MGKYGYNENVGTQHVRLVTKGDTMANKKVKVYTYKRVSTSMQVDGYSLDAQNDRMEKYAEFIDMVFAGSYSDEGKSGKNIAGRTDFQRMLNDIAAKKDNVKFVLVFKLSVIGIPIQSNACSGILNFIFVSVPEKLAAISSV